MSTILYKVLATKDQPTKRRRRWIDGIIEYDPKTNVAKLFALDEHGNKTGSVVDTVQVKRSSNIQEAIPLGEEMELTSGWFWEAEQRLSPNSEMAASTNPEMSNFALPTVRHSRPVVAVASLKNHPIVPQYGKQQQHQPVHLMNPGSNDIRSSNNVFIQHDVVVVQELPSNGTFSQPPKRPRTDAEILAMMLGTDVKVDVSLSSSHPVASLNDNRENQFVDVVTNGISNMNDENKGRLSLLGLRPFVATKPPVSVPNENQRTENQNKMDLSFKSTTPIVDEDLPIKQLVSQPGEFNNQHRKKASPVKKQTTLDRFLLPSNRSTTGVSLSRKVSTLVAPPSRTPSQEKSQGRRVNFPWTFESVHAYSTSMHAAWVEEMQATLNAHVSQVVLKEPSLVVVGAYGGLLRHYLSSNELTLSNRKALQLGDCWILTLPNNKQVLFESVWYSASQDGRIELKPLNADATSMIASLSTFPAGRIPVGRSQTIKLLSARQGPCLRSDLQSKRLLEDETRLNNDLVRNIATGAKSTCGGARRISCSREHAQQTFDRVSKELRLNLTPAQTSVVWAVIERCFDLGHEDSAIASPKNDFVVVHGPFGSGKSQTIAFCVRLLFLLSSQVETNEDSTHPSIRVGISALTNVAVDRVLLEMVDFNDTLSSAVDADSEDEVALSEETADPTRMADDAANDCAAVVTKLPLEGDEDEDDDGQDMRPEAMAKYYLPTSEPRWDNTRVARIGSVRNTNKQLLPRMIHVSKRSLNDAEHELAQLRQGILGESLAAPNHPEVTKIVDEALENLKRARDIAEQAFVVGFTCFSSENEEEMSLVFGKDERQMKVLFLDEASQIFEPVALLPIVNSNAGVVCIFGDPHQLPPVSPFESIRDQLAAKDSTCDLSATLFGRLSRVLQQSNNDSNQATTKDGQGLIMLDRSFRCHPEICSLASNLFYGGAVSCGIDWSQRLSLVPGLPPISLLNMDFSTSTETRNGSSFSNRHECLKIAQVTNALVSKHGIRPSQIAIASFYLAQTSMLRSHIPDELIKIATVDAFQGFECDFIFFSAVRTHHMSKFSELRERINVLLTRAKFHLVIVGSSSALRKSLIWNQILQKSKPCNISN